MKKRAVRAWTVLVIALTVFIMAGCSRPDQAKISELEAANQALEQKVAAMEKELKEATDKLEQGREITLYFTKNTPTESWLVPEIRTIPNQPDMLKAALEELIKGTSSPDLVSLIPVDTKVLNVTVKNSIAYADFSAEITRLSVGSRGEALVISSIANTLIKFPEVEKVQILINGKTVESLAGHIDMSKPVGRNETVLYPEIF